MSEREKLSGPELAASRAFAPRSPCLRAVPVSIKRPPYQRVSPSLLATISRGTLPSPLDPDTWNRVLGEAEVPGRETIVAALRDGVPFSLEDTVFPGVRVPNHPMLYFDLPRVKQEIEKEVLLGRYVKLPPTTDPSQLNVSAMGVAPRFKSFATRREFEAFAAQYRSGLKTAANDDFNGKPVSAGPGLSSLVSIKGQLKWRVIHDLSHPRGLNVNSFVESPSFQFPTAVRFAQRLTRNSYIWKGDIESAYRIVRVRLRDTPLLAFYVDGILYVDTRLPFGHALSPYYFVNFVGRPVLYIAMRRGATLYGILAGYVDDFFGACETYEQAVDQMQLWLRVCSDLGIPVSMAKTFLPSRIVEILGYIINTESMTISVDPERIQDALDEMSHIVKRSTVKRRDLESLAGKVVFICSVVPGGRTFMREILNCIEKRDSRSHWIHLTAGFRADVRWWHRFAQRWNGVEAIPPAVSVPWRWLNSDASGETGIGLFLCGAALHVPALLTSVHPGASNERDLIIAETELVAAVMLVALSAPLLTGEHVLVGVDNTVAISWLDKGTSPRPRAMRALRFLWRVQATFRIHVSFRYIRSEDNSLADAASRRDAPRFARESVQWLESHSASLSSSRIETHRRSSLVTTPYGPTGGAVGNLARLLVEGHPSGVRHEEEEVDRILLTFSTFAPRFVAQQHCRLHHVPNDDRESRSTIRLQLDQGLRQLLGESNVLYLSGASEPCEAPRGTALPSGCRPTSRQEGGQSRRMPVGPPARAEPLCSVPTNRSGGSDCSNDRCDRVLGVLAPRLPHSQGAGEAIQGSHLARHRAERNVPRPVGTSLQDHPIWRASASSRPTSASRSPLVPLEDLCPMDLALATPIIPDSIVRAVHDKSRNAVAFAVPRSDQPRDPPTPSSHGPLVPSWLRPPSLHPRCSDLADHAPRRLEDSGSRHVVRGRCADSESTRRTVSWLEDPPP